MVGSKRHAFVGVNQTSVERRPNYHSIVSRGVTNTGTNTEACFYVDRAVSDFIHDTTARKEGPMHCSTGSRALR